MRNRIAPLLVLAALLLFVLASSGLQPALAQSYQYQVDRMTVNVYWNEDGTQSLDYLLDFTNLPNAHPIDYVDLGMPGPYFDENSITADVNGVPLTDISSSGFQGTGNGVAIGMGPHTIPPGQTGSLHVFVGRVENVLYEDPAEDDYASGVFAPATFASSGVRGSTDLTVIFHLPPGVKPEEPRWHPAPTGFPDEPETALDEQGRVMYTWHNPQANPSRSYLFGASFPVSYVPAPVVQEEPSPPAPVGTINLDWLFPLACMGFFGLMIVWGIISESRRKLQYLPPKIAIEGHGIKRGLTAVEAAVLMEQPLDKVLTMILFAVIKKGAAAVKTRGPLEIEVAEPLPSGLHPYETEFLAAFQTQKLGDRRKLLQAMFVNVIQSLSQKMKGFSRRETIDYYRSITERAWQQVEAADTPEVKSEKFNEVMEWTMLDRRYDDRTRDVFRGAPVFLPGWWGRYDPTYGRSSGVPVPTTTQAPPVGRSTGRPSGDISLPQLPGADFAASIVGGVQGFSERMVGNVTEFTDRITGVTNPVPKSTSHGSSRSGGGGRSCACACACAGCACACAGGGR